MFEMFDRGFKCKECRVKSKTWRTNANLTLGCNPLFINKFRNKNIRVLVCSLFIMLEL